MAVPVPQPSRRSGREFKVPDRLGAPLNITDFDEDEEEVVEGDDAESSSEYGNTFKKPKKAPRRKAKKRAASQQQMMISTRGAKRKSTASSTSEKKGAKSQKTSAKGNPRKLAEFRNAQKPPPVGEPSVWADNRMALCESVPYYNAYQSGASTKENICTGMLIAYDASPRLHFNEEIVITRSAGGYAPNRERQLIQVRDHTRDDVVVRAMFHTRDMGIPVVLIAGNDNSVIPTCMPRNFNVLDFFQITNIWPEKNGRNVCYKFRFEKINLEKRSWWAPAGTVEPQGHDFTIQLQQGRCVYCGKLSAQIFKKWVCLNELCARFWTYASGVAVSQSIEYDQAFLNQRTKWPDNLRPPYQLRTPLFVLDGHSNTMAYSEQGWLGMCCPNCGCCNSRIHWFKWECSGCGFTHRVDQPLITASAVNARAAQYQFDGLAIACNLANRRFIEDIECRSPGNYRVTIYKLPSPGNYVYHFSANKLINSAPGGPDDLFLQMQKQDIGLKRHALGGRTDRGANLTNHFAANFGMPYKYILDVGTKAFKDAPAPILTALQRLRWAGKEVGQTEEEQFNELLAVGYYAGGKMGFHDDGERELGSTVATLALGAPSEMKLRMKKKYFIGSNSSSFDPAMDIIPGSRAVELRQSLRDRSPFLSQTQIKREWSNIQKAANGDKWEVALTIRFKHGDIVVMHGADIQKYYEHEVVNNGDLRFALTSRHIKWSMVRAEHHHKADFDQDIYPPYDGRKDAMQPTQDPGNAAPAAIFTTSEVPQLPSSAFMQVDSETSAALADTQASGAADETTSPSCITAVSAASSPLSETFSSATSPSAMGAEASSAAPTAGETKDMVMENSTGAAVPTT